jgi:hypothetical protein
MWCLSSSPEDVEQGETVNVVFYQRKRHFAALSTSLHQENCSDQGSGANGQMDSSRRVRAEPLIVMRWHPMSENPDMGHPSPVICPDIAIPARSLLPPWIIGLRGHPRVPRSRSLCRMLTHHRILGDSPGFLRFAHFFADLVEIDARSFDAEERGDHGSKHRGDDEAVKQETRADRS